MVEAGYSIDYAAQICGLSMGPNRESVIKTLSFFKAEQISAEGLDLFTVQDFLNDQECAYFRQWIDGNKEASRLGTQRTISGSQTRQSQVAYALDLERQDPIFRMLKLKITGLLGIPAIFTESFQGQVYDTQGFYKSHYDVFDSENPLDLRSWTLIINLNTVKAGGETEFPKFDLKIKAKQGQAIIFNSLNAYIQRNELSLHGGLPIMEGKKYIITQWFRLFDQYT